MYRRVYRRRGRNNKAEGEQRAKEQRVLSWPLPQDITLNILSRLPVKSLMRCRCVCKPWRTSISTPYLINMHLERVSQADDPDILFVDFHDNLTDETKVTRDLFVVENVGTHNEMVKAVPLPDCLKSFHIVDSCNGLICFTNSPNCDRLIYVYNPCTRECVQLPPSPYHRYSLLYGFGHNYTLDEYKVLVFISLEPYSDDTKTLAQVCTLGSDSWRTFIEVPFTPIYPPSYFFKDGTLYWMSFDLVDKKLVGIGSFDIADEKFRFVPLPPKIFSNLDTHYLEMGVLGGFISVIDFSCGERTEVWVSNNYREESWMKQCVLSLPNKTKLMRLLGTLKNGEIIFFNNYDKLVTCDPSKRQFRDLGVQGVSEIIESYFHIGTLISPVRGCGAE